MKAKIKKLTDSAKIPKLGSDKAAGYDLYADSIEGGGAYYHIKPHQTVMVHTGLAITPPEGYFAAVFARSGLAKKGLAPANKVGVCDEDYTGEIMIALHNHSDDDMKVEVGDRVAQLVFLPYVHPEMIEVDDLESTDRGAGGFGSTGS